MKYLVVVFWSLILGFVASFIGSALTNTTMNAQQTIVVMVIFGLVLCILPALLKHFEQN